MAYNEFAYFYDEFNGEADYDALYAHIHKELTAHGIADGILADLGCGTGQLPGVARIFGGVDGIIGLAPPGPGGSGSDLRDELDGTVLLARSGVQ